MDMNAFLRQIVPLYEHMDVHVDPPESGVFRVHTPYRKELVSHVGTIHPAFQWAAAELLGGVVALTALGGLDGVFLVVRGVNIEFKRPAKSDITAECVFTDEQAAALRDSLAAGEGNFALAMTVKDANGETVATATGDYLVRPRRAA